MVSLYDAADYEWDPRVGVLRSVPVVPPGDGDDTPWTKARERLARDPAVSPVPVSADGSATPVSVRLEDSAAGVAELRPVLDRLAALSRTIADASGLQIRMAGVPAIRRELYDLVRREALVFGLVGTGLIVLVSLALFAGLSEACVGAVPPLLATGWTVGLLGLLGEPLNVVNVVVPVLIVVNGSTNALHLHLGIRRAEWQGASPDEAVIDALARIGPACALAAITTAIGFASLAAAKSDVIRHFGLVCAAGALAAMLATVTVTPALCLVVPRGRARRPWRCCGRTSSSPSRDRGGPRCGKPLPTSRRRSGESSR